MREGKNKKRKRDRTLIEILKRFHKKNFFKPLLKKKKEKTLEDKLKIKKKTKEISDAVEKESQSKFKRNFEPVYGRFKDFLDVAYGHQDALGADVYAPQIDYEQLFSYFGSGVKLEYGGQEKSFQGGFSSRKGEMTFEEAESTVRKIQYNLMLKSVEKMDVKEKERFAYWQEFNKVLLLFYHKNSAVRTDEVDYGAVNQAIYT